MSITEPASAPARPPGEPPRAARSAPGRRRRAAAWGRRWLGRLGVVAALAFNAWWFARDVRPLPDFRELRALVDRGETARAEPALRELLRRSPHHDEARMLLARVLASRSELIACAAELHAVPFWSPRKPEALYLEGLAHIQGGRARPAEAAWRACIVDDPLHPVPWDILKPAVESLIELYALEQRWEEAHEVVWRLHDEVPPSERENVLIMRLRMEVERIETPTALAQLRPYVAADPADLHARRALALYEQARGATDEAIRQLEVCLKVDPDDPATWRELLRILKDRGDTRGLADAVARLPESADRDGVLWEIRGVVRESSGDHAGALEAFERAAALRPYESEVHYRLGLALGRLGRREEGLARVRHSQVLQQARATLFDSYVEFHYATEPGTTRGAGFVRVTRELAEKCRTLGMARVADGLDALLGLPTSPDAPLQSPGRAG